jgi:hypothetical protein
MRFNFLAAAAALAFASLAPAAWAGQAGASTAPVAQMVQPAPGAAADKVYPPLPTLAMLPPTSSGDEDEPLSPPTHSSSHSKKKVRHPDCHCSGAPVVHLVVSDTSRAYLQDVEHKLDVALAH